MTEGVPTDEEIEELMLEMVDEGLLEMSVNDEGKALFRLTEKGTAEAKRVIEKEATDE